MVNHLLKYICQYSINRLKLYLLLLILLAISSCAGAGDQFFRIIDTRSDYKDSLDNLEQKIDEKKSREKYKALNKPCPAKECQDKATDVQLDKDIEKLIIETKNFKIAYHDALGWGCLPKDCSEPDLYSTEHQLK